MKLTRYGITLRRISINEFEKVRKARNAVRRLMDYKEFITPEVRLEWFNSINNPNNFYYIIEYQNEDAGLIHEKNASTDPGAKDESSEGEIFLFDEKYHTSPAPVLAALILIEKGFFIFGDAESVIHIVKENEQAIRFNKALGYELCEGQENISKQKYILTKEMFIAKTRKIRKAALKLSKTENKIVSVFTQEDYDTGLGEVLEGINKKMGLDYELNDNGDKVYTYYFDDL